MTNPLFGPNQLKIGVVSGHQSIEDDLRAAG